MPSSSALIVMPVLAFRVQDGDVKPVMVQPGMTIDPALVQDEKPSKDQLSEMNEADLATILRSASLPVAPNANKTQLADAIHKDWQAGLAAAQKRVVLSGSDGQGGRHAESDQVCVAVQGIADLSEQSLTTVFPEQALIAELVAYIKREWRIKEQAYLQCYIKWGHVLRDTLMIWTLR